MQWIRSLDNKCRAGLWNVLSVAPLMLTIVIVMLLSNLVLVVDAFAKTDGILNSPHHQTRNNLLQSRWLTVNNFRVDRKTQRHHLAITLHEQGSQRREHVRSFIDKVEDSIDNESFVSLTLRGVKANKPSKRNGPIDQEDIESLRGSIRQVQGRLIRLANTKGKNKEIEPSTLLQLTIKYHLATDVVKNIDLVDIPNTLNNLLLDPSMASEWGVQAVRSHPMRGALLETTNEAWDLALASKPTMKRQQVKAGNKAPSTLSHDRTKQVPLAKDAEFLKLLGVTNADGTPRPGMSSKVCVCVVWRVPFHSQNFRAKLTFASPSPAAPPMSKVCGNCSVLGRKGDTGYSSINLRS
jgi:hypothetical protein